MRHDGRSSTQMRPIKITPHFTKNATGSVLYESGDTRVLCTVCVEESVPGWMRAKGNKATGWLTAEYSMLPGSTHTRSRRERPAPSGRSQEIQRLIGRSLRGVIDLKQCQEKTLMIDCDVLQADGGTRTAAITGAYIALKIAVDKLLRAGKLKNNPLIGQVAAVSIGIKDDQLLMDLDYKEDSTADLDMNIVMLSDGKILEIQGTAEQAPFTREQVNDIMDAATEALSPVFELQLQAADSDEGETLES